MAFAVYRGLYEATRDPVHLVCAARSARFAKEFALANRLGDLLLQEFGTLHPSCMEAGFCKLEAGANAEAHSAFHAAYRAERKADAAAWCGVALRRAGNVAAACDYYRLALRLDPNQPTAGLELASHLDETGDFLGAVDLYRHCLKAELSPDRTFMYNRIGVCCERAGRRDLLAQLLEEPDYYHHLSAGYAPESTLIWSLKLQKPICDKPVLAELRRQLPLSNGVVDALSLYLQTDLSQELQESYLLLLQSSAYGVEAERILRAYPPDRVHSRLSQSVFVSEDNAVQLICNHIRAGRPFSLVRLGDGEGNVLGHLTDPTSPFLGYQAEKIVRNWFGASALPLSGYSDLFGTLQDAIDGADLLGVPTPARLNYELRNEPRGYWGVYFAALYSCSRASGAQFVTPVLHLQLFRYGSFLDALRSTRRLDTVSCHPGLGPKLRSELGIPQGTDLVVPGEMESAALPEGIRRGSHYPTEYERVCRQITAFEPGSTVLIAAGICGKIYAHRAKQAGCVAIDIGAIADFLMGCNTRAIFTDQQFRDAHAVAKHLVTA